jgi:hypothetical protein
MYSVPQVTCHQRGSEWLRAQAASASDKPPKTTNFVKSIQHQCACCGYNSRGFCSPLDAPVANAACVCCSSRAHPPAFPVHTAALSFSSPLLSSPPLLPHLPFFHPHRIPLTAASMHAMHEATAPATRGLYTSALAIACLFPLPPSPHFCSHFRRLTLPLRTPPASATFCFAHFRQRIVECKLSQFLRMH